MAQDERQQVGPPYCPADGLVKVIRHLRDRGFPKGPVDGDYLVRAGLSVESVANQYLRGLRFLRLIDSGGLPTETANALKVASSEDYPSKLLKALENAYPRVFEVLDPASATKQKIEDAFRYEKPDGRRRRMVSCFVSLCEEAGIQIANAPTTKRAATSNGVSGKRRVAPAKKTNTEASKQDRGVDNWSELSRLSELPAGLRGVLAALPDIESVEDLENWLSAFKSIFLLTKKA